MKSDLRKVVIVGAGMVGMSYAYALLNQNACDELLLIDIHPDKVLGESMDLNHGLAFSTSGMRIRAGTYADCSDAGIIALCAGVAQRPGESRLELLKRNADVFRSIVQPVLASGFQGLFLIATNPVDLMTRITYTLSGFDERRVIGTGTALDTARLRYLLGNALSVSSRNIHAYVMGEHGDSEFVPWSQASLGPLPILELCRSPEHPLTLDHLWQISDEVRDAAQQIIAAKGATYYGIGMGMVRITNAIFGNENSIVTVSARLDGQYGVRGVFAGVPCIIGRQGVDRMLTLSLTDQETQLFRQSCGILEAAYEELEQSGYFEK